MPASSSTSSSAGRFLGICAAFAVFAVVGIYSSRMAYHTTGYDDDEAKERYARLAKLQADDRKTLTTADWIDQAKGTVRIPIDEAMTQEVALLKARPVQIGTALPAAAPAPAAATPAAGTPAVSSKAATTNSSSGSPAATNAPSASPSTNAPPAAAPSASSSTNAAPAAKAPSTPTAKAKTTK
jgi:hypothetical protein